MKKAITLTTFLKTFEQEHSDCIKSSKRPITFFNSITYNKDLPFEKKLKFVGYIYELSKSLNFKNNAIYCIRYGKKLCRSGKTFYPTIVNKDSIYISRNEISLKCNGDFIEDFLKDLNITWFKDIPTHITRTYFKNKIIFRRIITGRIYNEETFYKSIATVVYKVKNISWRTVRLYCESCNFDLYYLSIADLRDFTKNIEQSIKVLAETKEKNIYQDLLGCAVKLNETVDFTWSKKRIEEEHKRQIEILLEKEISAKNEDPIYEVDPNPFWWEDIEEKYPNFKLLNTEKEIFLEGKLMHHCIYNAYYNRIANHSYIAFHITSPEDCTLGIDLVNGEPHLNQIYLKYDQEVSNETKVLAHKFIEDNASILKWLFNQKVKESKNTYNINTIEWI